MVHAAVGQNIEHTDQDDDQKNGAKGLHISPLTYRALGPAPLDLYRFYPLARVSTAMCPSYPPQSLPEALFPGPSSAPWCGALLRRGQQPRKCRRVSRIA